MIRYMDKYLKKLKRKLIYIKNWEQQKYIKKKNQKKETKPENKEISKNDETQKKPEEKVEEKKNKEEITNTIKISVKFGVFQIALMKTLLTEGAVVEENKKIFNVSKKKKEDKE